LDAFHFGAINGLIKMLKTYSSIAFANNKFYRSVEKL